MRLFFDVMGWLGQHAPGPWAPRWGSGSEGTCRHEWPVASGQWSVKRGGPRAMGIGTPVVSLRFHHSHPDQAPRARLSGVPGTPSSPFSLLTGPGPRDWLGGVVYSQKGHHSDSDRGPPPVRPASRAVPASPAPGRWRGRGHCGSRRTDLKGITSDGFGFSAGSEPNFASTKAASAASWTVLVPTGRKARGGCFAPPRVRQSGDGALPTAFLWVTAPSLDEIATIHMAGQAALEAPRRGSGRLTSG
jgi:hypothetical protein